MCARVSAEKTCCANYLVIEARCFIVQVECVFLAFGIVGKCDLIRELLLIGVIGLYKAERKIDEFKGCD